MTLPCTPGRRRGAVGAALVGLLSPLALASPAWASDVANEVVYTADADNDGLYTIELRNLETQRSVTLLPEDAANRWTYDDPELSPDGGRVVLSTDRGSATGQEGIAVVNRDGSGFRRLTEPPRTATTESVDLGSAWSPTGDRVLFTRITTPLGSRDPLGVRTALHVVPAAGGAAVPYGQAADGYTGDWSPDGTRVVFAALAAGADSGPLTVISSDPASTAGRTSLGVTGLMPAWSPDGTTIAYATITARDTDRARAQDTALIATVPAAGGAQRLLSVTRPDPARASVAEYPAWSPDGQSIVYDLFGYGSGADLPPGDLWAVDRAGVRAGRLLRTAGDETQPHLQGPAPSAVSAGASSSYVPVTPRRVLDTRPAPNNVGAPAARIGAGGTVDLRVHGLTTDQGAVPTTATAVVLNVTAVDPSAATDVRVYPTPADGAVPRSSNLNTGPGQVVPNLVTATIGSGGSVRLRNAAGSVHLIADVAGYYVPSGAGGSGFTAVDPGRVDHVPRDLLEEGAQHPDRDRQVQRGVEDDQAAHRAEQLEVAVDDEEGGDHAGRGEELGRDEEEEDVLRLLGRPDRHRVGGGDGEQHHEQRRDARGDDRVDEEGGEVEAEDRPVVLERRVEDQLRRKLDRGGLGLEAGQEHVQDRVEDDQADDPGRGGPEQRGLLLGVTAARSKPAEPRGGAGDSALSGGGAKRGHRRIALASSGRGTGSAA